MITRPERHTFVSTPDGVGVVRATSREYVVVDLPEHTLAYKLSEVTQAESELIS